MDGSTIAIIVTSVLTLVLNVYQSIKMNHFQSTCGKDCCSMTHDMENQAGNADRPRSASDTPLFKPQPRVSDSAITPLSSAKTAN